jgi:hypothetical protein
MLSQDMGVTQDTFGPSHLRRALKKELLLFMETAALAICSGYNEPFILSFLKLDGFGGRQPLCGGDGSNFKSGYL